MTADRRRPLPLLTPDAVAAAHHKRGVAHVAAGRHAEAVAAFSLCLDHDPTPAAAWFHRGCAYLNAGDPARALADRWRAVGQLGRHAAALADARRAVELRPDDVVLVNQLAWLLATCPDDGVRNGPAAVALATRAAESSAWRDAAVLDTLAAAYAECGSFDEAVRWGEAALALAPSEVADAIRVRLATF